MPAEAQNSSDAAFFVSRFDLIVSTRSGRVFNSITMTTLLYRQSFHRHLLFPSSRSINPPFRSFHATARARSLDVLLNGTQAVLETLHTVTGTSWVVTLPLAAMLVRATILLPFTIRQRRILQTQASLSPVLHGWLSIYKREVAHEVGKAGPEAYVRALKKRQDLKTKELYKRWGVERWRLWVVPLTQLPIWLIMVESIRRMCGKEEGLLALVVGGFNKAKTSLGFGGSAPIDPATAQSIVDADVLQRATHIVPEFGTEGALWFQNLLVADPQLVLPFALSGVILLNLFGKNGLNTTLLGLKKKDWRSRLTRSLGVVALAIAPMTLQVPAAMMVYWISSSALAFLQANLMDRWMPVVAKQPMKPKWTLMDEKGLPNALKPGPLCVKEVKEAEKLLPEINKK